MQVVIGQAGYTVKVVSWENDGDHYCTKSVTYETKEKAIAVANLCKKVFASQNNGKGGVGNSDYSDKKSRKIIIPFMKANPILYSDEAVSDDDSLMDICSEYHYELLGSSEYYSFRVCESVEITYLPQDVVATKIQF